MKIEAQNIAEGTFEIEAQQNVIANKFSQVEDQGPVTISNGMGLFCFFSHLFFFLEILFF